MGLKGKPDQRLFGNQWRTGAELMARSVRKRDHGVWSIGAGAEAGAAARDSGGWRESGRLAICGERRLVRTDWLVLSEDTIANAMVSHGCG